MSKLLTTFLVLLFSTTTHSQAVNSNFLIGIWKIESGNPLNKNSLTHLNFGKDVVLFVLDSDYVNGSWHYRFDSLNRILVLTNFELNGNQFSDTLTFQTGIINNDMILLKLSRVSFQDDYSKNWTLKTIGSSPNNWERLKEIK